MMIQIGITLMSNASSEMVSYLGGWLLPLSCGLFNNPNFFFMWQLASKKRQKQKLPGLLRVQCHFSRILLVKTSHKASLHSTRGEIDSTSVGKSGVCIQGWERFLLAIFVPHLYHGSLGFIFAVSRHKF